jgi:hypothetical protein
MLAESVITDTRPRQGGAAWAVRKPVITGFWRLNVVTAARVRTPSYRLHKPSGQAVVTLKGRDFYLGRHGSPESRAEYDRLVGEWLANGRRLPGSGLPVAMALRFFSVRFRGANRRGLDDIARELRISTDSARRGLHAAELAGLLDVDREPGCKLSISVLDLPEPEAGPLRRPLFGPIPWAWWLPASRLPGKALQVASACWLSAGWSRSAEFELALDGWSEFGLSRFSARRGLDELEKSGLVSVTRSPGRRAVVAIMDVQCPSEAIARV